MEQFPTRSTNWLDIAANTDSEQSLADTAVDFEQLQAWSDTPDVVEGGQSELAPPFGGDTDTTADCGEFVTDA